MNKPQLVATKYAFHIWGKLNPLLFPHIDFNSNLIPSGKVFVIFIPFHEPTKETWMRYFLLFFILLYGSTIWAQTDFGTIQPLNIPSNTPLDHKSSDQGTSLKIPSIAEPKKNSPNLLESMKER